MKDKNILVLAVLFSIIFLLFLGKFTLLDYDEACYAEVSREMYSKGDLITPRLNGEPFYEKPPLLYWFQALGFSIFGISAFGARVFNSIAGIATILAAYLFARRPLGERTAFFSALILGSNMVFAYLARVALTDMLLTLGLVLCVGFLHRAVEDSAFSNSRGTAWFLAACFSSGIAVLAKGAIGILLPAGTLLIFLLVSKKLGFLFSPLRLFTGIFVLCGVGFSWYLLLGFSRPDGFLFMRDLFVEHHIVRFTHPLQGHSGPFFYYIPVLFVGFIPWSAFFPLALKRSGVFKPRDERTRFLCLFAVFAAVTFILFSLASTKLPNYILPAFPFLAFITGMLFAKDEHTTLRGAKWTWPVLITVLLGVILALVLVFLPEYIPRLPDVLGEDARKAPGLFYPVNTGFVPIAAVVILMSGAIAVIVSWRKNSPPRMMWPLTASAFGVVAVLLFLVMSVYDGHFVSPLKRLSVEAGKLLTDEERILLVNLDDRPSVNFYSGRYIEYLRLKGEKELEEPLNNSGLTLGITTDYYYTQLEKRNMSIYTVRKDTGYVLFRFAKKTTVR